MRSYLAIIRSAFLGMLAYRMRYLTGILTYTLFVSVNYFIWKAIYSTYPEGTSLHGFHLKDMVTYLAVGWIARSFYFSTIDEDIEELVRSGQISIFLLRPMNFHLTMLSQAIGESLFRMSFFTLPISLVILSLFPISAPASVSAGVLFFLSSVTSFFILVELNFCIGLLAFELQSIQGLNRAKYYLLQLFSGLLMPVAFFPDWFRKIIEILPFRFITAVPMEAYLGKIEGMDWVLLQEVFWILVMWSVSSLLWSRAMNRLTLQGG